MKNFRKELKKRILILDGAMGTILQSYGIKGGSCLELLNIEKPGWIEEIHKSYIDAGVDIIETNTFGGNRLKLKEYNLEKKLKELNIKAVKIAKKASKGRDAFISGSIGPTGQFVEPVGGVSFDETVKIFREQAEALIEGGVDLFSLETFLDIKELKAAIAGIREVSNLPIIGMMTFESNLRTVLGTPPESAAIVMEGLCVDVIGVNCSLGIEGIIQAVMKMAGVTELPLCAQPNAGIPVFKEGKTIFPASPGSMAERIPELLNLGVNVIGGCCGTTPEHIKKIAEKVKEYGSTPALRCKTSISDSIKAASRTSYIIFGANSKPVIIGERINPTGKKAFQQELKEGKAGYIQKEAVSQKEAGAHLLDVNVGMPGIDEVKLIKNALFTVNASADLPVVIDSSNPEAIEEALKACDGRPVINSISGEERTYKKILPLAKKYGASVIALTLDEKGIPKTAQERLKIAERIVKICKEYGIAKNCILIDCLTLTVSAEQEKALETVKTIKLVKKKLRTATVLGVSNVSFGLPARGNLNAAFFAMALGAGLDAAIINPNNELMMDIFNASAVLTGSDLGASSYIEKYRNLQTQPEQKKEELQETYKERIFKAIVNGGKEGIIQHIEEALSDSLKPMEISNSILIPALEEVGKRFDKNIMFLPQVLVSAETMKIAFVRLKKEMKGEKLKSKGKVLLATVEGDIHDIGKNIVGTLMENHGFEVIDLGKNVPAEKIIQKAIEEKVDIVGLSALMTTTVMEMENVMKKLKAKGISVFTMVGGAVVTQDFADRIGASAYAKDAMEAVEKAKKLLG